MKARPASSSTPKSPRARASARGRARRMRRGRPASRKSSSRLLTRPTRAWLRRTCLKRTPRKLRKPLGLLGPTLPMRPRRTRLRMAPSRAAVAVAAARARPCMRVRPESRRRTLPTLRLVKRLRARARLRPTSRLVRARACCGRVRLGCCIRRCGRGRGIGVGRSFRFRWFRRCFRSRQSRSCAHEEALAALAQAEGCSQRARVPRRFHPPDGRRGGPRRRRCGRACPTGPRPLQVVQGARSGLSPHGRLPRRRRRRARLQARPRELGCERIASPRKRTKNGGWSLPTASIPRCCFLARKLPYAFMLAAKSCAATKAARSSSQVGIVYTPVRRAIMLSSSMR